MRSLVAALAAVVLLAGCGGPSVNERVQKDRREADRLTQEYHQELKKLSEDGR